MKMMMNNMRIQSTKLTTTPNITKMLTSISRKMMIHQRSTMTLKALMIIKIRIVIIIHFCNQRRICRISSMLVHSLVKDQAASLRLQKCTLMIISSISNKNIDLVTKSNMYPLRKMKLMS